MLSSSRLTIAVLVAAIASANVAVRATVDPVATAALEMPVEVIAATTEAAQATSLVGRIATALKDFGSTAAQQARNGVELAKSNPKATAAIVGGGAALVGTGILAYRNASKIKSALTTAKNTVTTYVRKAFGAAKKDKPKVVGYSAAAMAIASAIIALRKLPQGTTDAAFNAAISAAKPTAEAIGAGAINLGTSALDTATSVVNKVNDNVLTPAINTVADHKIATAAIAGATVATAGTVAAVKAYQKPASQPNTTFDEAVTKWHANPEDMDLYMECYKLAPGTTDKQKRLNIPTPPSAE